jgi:transcriptional regulatory protein LevR
MKETKYKLNIFDVLSKISKKNSDFYDDLSIDEQKSVQPLVLLRWLTGIKSARQIMFLNEFVNPRVFSLTKHKKLLIQLMTICTSGTATKYTWKKAISKKGSKSPKSIAVIQDIFKYNSRHATDALPLLSTEDILQFAEQLGRQPPEIRDIKKELKNRNL